MLTTIYFFTLFFVIYWSYIGRGPCRRCDGALAANFFMEKVFLVL